MKRLTIVSLAMMTWIIGACADDFQSISHHHDEDSSHVELGLAHHADDCATHGAHIVGGAKAASPNTGQQQDPKPHDGCQCKPAVKRTLYHEMGHVKWNRLDAHQQAVWTEIWELSQDLEIQPNEPYLDKNGKIANYYEVNAMEGFCVAYSFIKTGESVDSTITNFFDSL